MAEHSKLLSPSASAIWTVCTAMPRAFMDSGLPNTSSNAADRGTLQHSYSEQVKKGTINTLDCPGELTADEWDQVLTACEAAEELFKADQDGKVTKFKDYHEMAVGFSDWREDCFGTSDLVRVDVTLRTLYVLDDKYGRVAVEAEGNTQMMTYALAVIETFKRKNVDLCSMIDNVVLGILQPKVSKKASVHRMTLDELLEWDRTVLEPAQRAVLDDKGMFVPGPHCKTKYCKFVSKCTAALAKAEEDMDDFMDLYTGERKVSLVGMEAEKLSRFLQSKVLVSKMFEEAEAIAIARLEQGIDFPHFKLVNGRGKRKWVDVAEAEKYLKGKIPADAMFNKELVTAPQAEKLLKKAGKLEATVSQNKFAEHIVFKEGNATLAHESDPRPAICTKVQDEEVDAAMCEVAGPVDDDLEAMLAEL